MRMQNLPFVFSARILTQSSDGFNGEPVTLTGSVLLLLLMDLFHLSRLPFEQSAVMRFLGGAGLVLLVGWALLRWQLLDLAPLARAAVFEHIREQRFIRIGQELSDRELQVFEMISSGLLNKEIAAQLGIGAKTVGSYKARLMGKLGITNVPDLVRAAKAGLLSVFALSPSAKPGGIRPPQTPAASRPPAAKAPG